MYSGYDLYSGYIADDTTTEALRYFLADAISYNCLMDCLNHLSLGIQYAAVTQRACDAMTIINEHKLTVKEKKELQQVARNRAYQANHNMQTAYTNRTPGPLFSSLLYHYLEEINYDS